MFQENKYLKTNLYNSTHFPNKPAVPAYSVLTKLKFLNYYSNLAPAINVLKYLDQPTLTKKVFPPIPCSYFRINTWASNKDAVFHTFYFSKLFTL